MDPAGGRIMLAGIYKRQVRRLDHVDRYTFQGEIIISG